METTAATEKRKMCAHPKRDGNPCPWRAKSPSPFCGIHQRVFSQKINKDQVQKLHKPVPVVEPWTQLGLDAPSNECSKRALRRIRAMLRRGPTAKDRAGHLYVYALEQDERMAFEYYKVGRTERGIHQRLAEWPGSKLRRGYGASLNRFAEALVHLWLDPWRIYRYAYTDGSSAETKYHSVWKKDGKTVQDSQALTAEEFAKRRRQHALRKHIEWFACDWAQLERVIRMVLRCTNNWLKKSKAVLL